MANKSAKKDLYADERDEKQDDTMDDWDTDKLNDVVNQKHGKEKNAKTTTLIVSRCSNRVAWNVFGQDLQHESLVFVACCVRDSMLQGCHLLRACLTLVHACMRTFYQCIMILDLQTLLEIRRERAVWLVLGVPCWRLGVQVPPCLAAWLRSQESSQGRRRRGGENIAHGIDSRGKVRLCCMCK